MTYVIWTLLLLKRFVREFTVRDVGSLWKERLPIACTAELAALEKGIGWESEIFIAVTQNTY